MAAAPDRLPRHRSWPVCEFIIGNLDEDGFLRASDEEIERALASASQRSNGRSPSCGHSILPAWGREPSRSALITQIDALIAESTDEARADVAGPGPPGDRASTGTDLLHQRWETIAATLGCDVSDLKSMLDVIQRLEPKPGRRSRRDRNQYIEPDVYVRKGRR